MEIGIVVKFLESFSHCWNCGNSKVDTDGSGKNGTFYVDKNIIHRSCSCGFKVELKPREMKGAT